MAAINMQKTKIEWCDYTWNPVVGCLYHCSYCYANRIATRFAGTKGFPNGFTPTFHENRLDEPRKLKTPSKIFVSSMGDLFGEWFSDETIQKVLDVARDCPLHTFIFLTKNPARYRKFKWADNMWLGATTINSDMAFKAKILFSDVDCKVKFLSFEPLRNIYTIPDLSWLQWIIIGAETGPQSEKNAPAYIDIQNLINHARLSNIPIFLKNNLKWPEQIREFPNSFSPSVTANTVDFESKDFTLKP
jgi:protein gp37